MLTERGAVRVVALRKESVDRNKAAFALADSSYWSLSARRAWIEIRKKPLRIKLLTLSLSARRAWIEIRPPLRLLTPAIVGRSPQGERG